MGTAYPRAKKGRSFWIWLVVQSFSTIIFAAKIAAPTK